MSVMSLKKMKSPKVVNKKQVDFQDQASSQSDLSENLENLSFGEQDDESALECELP